MGLRLITPPAVEPVTAAEVRLQQRIDQTIEDSLIDLWIAAARQAAEQQCDRAFLTQTLELQLDAFATEIALPRPRLIAVESVSYIDASTQALVTLDPGAYAIDAFNEPGWLLPAYGTRWPGSLEAANAVRVRYRAGYGPAATDVPAGIRAWILLRVGSLYKHREEVASGLSVATLPYVDRLLDPYRVWGL